MSGKEDWSANLTMAFASPILRFHVPNADSLNEKLTAESNALREASPTITHSKNRFGWHSEKDLMSRSEPGLSQLAGVIPKCVLAATRAISPQFDPKGFRLETEGWININPEHGYNAPHRHSGFMWSGCYYVTVPGVESGPSGCIEFLSPVIVPGEYRVLGAQCYEDRLTMRPSAGDMLLFPSYLNHWVFPNEASEERITIAFNATFLPR